MLHDDSQGHYTTVKLIDAIHRGVILLLTGPPPSTVMKCGLKNAFTHFPNPGLFLGRTAMFNYTVLWTTKTLDHQNCKLTETHWDDMTDTSTAAANNYLYSTVD